VTLDLIASLETNVPLDAKQLVEDRFPEGRLFHGLLQKVDPSSANFLHPNDRRKLVNALFAYFKQQQGV
jgi:tRNA A37 N6-isopentenylltransferase MiaA